MKKILLISGKMRSGKNQLADYLKEVLEEKGKIVKTDLFAKGVKDGSKEDFQELQSYLNIYSQDLKALMRDVFDDICNYVGDRGFDLLPMRYRLNDVYNKIDSLKIADENWYENKTEITRRLLQIYGTEIFRKRVQDNYWIKQTKKRIIETKADYILVTDVRFPNEIENMYSDKYELFTVRVERKSDSTNTSNEHESEKALDDFKHFVYTVDNNGSLSDLKASAISIISDIGEKYVV
jgi:thymidylate kinase